MVSRDGLWRIMAKYGYPEKFIIIVRQFHDSMHTRVQANWESSVAFPVTNGVKQGCILAPTLFSIMFSAMLFDAFNGSDNGIDIWYHSDSSVLNSEGFKQRPSWKLISSTSFCAPMTVPWRLLPKLTCKTMLTSSKWPMTILA